MKEIYLFVRPYYGVNIHTDAQGEYGSVLHSNDVFPDLPVINSATILNTAENIQAVILDAYAEGRILPDELISRVSEMTFDKLVIKTTTATVKSDLELIRQIKLARPGCYVITAGQTSADLKTWIKANTDIDQVITEPMDKYFYRLVYGTDGTLDDMPTPDYTLVNYKAYTDDSGRVRLTLLASRSCPMKCSYCPYIKYYGDYEPRDTDKVMDDVRTLVSLGAEVIQFRDQFFTCNKERIRDLCQRMIDENIKVSWICETKLSSLDEDLVDLMKKAGLMLVCFGVESGNKEILETYNSNKGELSDQIAKVKMLRDKGILTMAFYIIGFPEDTWESVYDTYKCAETIGSDIVNFNEYTTFYFEDKDSLTPDVFCQFANSTNIDMSASMSREEIRYAIDLFSTMYTAGHDCLEKAYTYNHKLMNAYKENVRRILMCDNDLYRLSEMLRDRT